MADGPDVTKPISAPPHFGARCAICNKHMNTATEPIYPGSASWTYRCADHRVGLNDALEKALLEAERAKYRDSNDGEIDALSDALDEALALLGRQRPTLSDEEIEQLENPDL